MSNIPLKQHTPIDWTAPENAAEKQALIEQFERTLPALVAKLDEVARYMDMEGVDYNQVRGHLVTRAYTDVWGLEGSTAILAVFVAPDPTDEVAMSYGFMGDHSRWGVDLGDTVLLDTGATTLKDYFAEQDEALKSELQQVRASHPGADILRLKGGVVAGLSRSRDWNHEAVAETLREILKDERLASPGALH